MTWELAPSARYEPILMVTDCRGDTGGPSASYRACAANREPGGRIQTGQRAAWLCVGPGGDPPGSARGSREEGGAACGQVGEPRWRASGTLPETPVQ